MHFARLVEQAKCDKVFATYMSFTDLVATYLSLELTYIHNIDTFSAMSKGSKDYVMLKQGSNTFLLITFLIFNRFSIRKNFGKLRLRPFQPYYPMLCMSKGSKVIECIYIVYIM